MGAGAARGSRQLLPLSAERGRGHAGPSSGEFSRLAPVLAAQAPTTAQGPRAKAPQLGASEKGQCLWDPRLGLRGRTMGFTQPSSHRFKDFVYTYRIFREKNGYHVQVSAPVAVGGRGHPSPAPAARRHLLNRGRRAELASQDDAGTGCGPVCVKVAGTHSPGCSASAGEEAAGRGRLRVRAVRGKAISRSSAVARIFPVY